MTDMADNMIAWFKKHADYIAETALDYPAHEVNYEQSIVAPATNILLQTYIVTNENKYLDAAKIQLDVLELFLRLTARLSFVRNRHTSLGRLLVRQMSTVRRYFPTLLECAYR